MLNTNCSKIISHFFYLDKPVQLRLYNRILGQTRSLVLTPDNIVNNIEEESPNIYLIIHGFQANANEDKSNWMTQMKDKILYARTPKRHVVTVDWSDYAKDLTYTRPAAHTKDTVAPTIRNLLSLERIPTNCQESSLTKIKS